MIKKRHLNLSQQRVFTETVRLSLQNTPISAETTALGSIKPVHNQKFSSCERSFTGTDSKTKIMTDMTIRMSLCIHSNQLWHLIRAAFKKSSSTECFTARSLTKTGPSRVHGYLTSRRETCISSGRLQFTRISLSLSHSLCVSFSLSHCACVQACVCVFAATMRAVVLFASLHTKAASRRKAGLFAVNEKQKARLHLRV